MLLSLRLGALCGLANGLTTTLGRIEPFIVTLGTMGIFRSLTTWLAQGGSITIKSQRSGRPTARSISATCSACPFRFCAILAVTLDRRLHPLPHRLRPARARGRLERGRRALFRRQRRARAHASPTCCRACASRIAVHRLRAAARLDHVDDRAPLGANGDHRRRGRRHAAQGRRRPRLGHDRRRAHPRSRSATSWCLSNFVSEYLIGAVQGAIIIIAMLAQRGLTRGR